MPWYYSESLGRWIDDTAHRTFAVNRGPFVTDPDLGIAPWARERNATTARGPFITDPDPGISPSGREYNPTRALQRFTDLSLDDDDEDDDEEEEELVISNHESALVHSRVSYSELPVFNAVRGAQSVRWVSDNELRRRPVRMGHQELAQEFFGNIMPPVAFNGDRRGRFQESGRAWYSHVVDTYNWERDIVTTPNTPLDIGMICTGCRIICMDHLHDYVACPDASLSDERCSLDEKVLNTIRNTRLLLIPYSADTVAGHQWVLVVYDTKDQTAYTFDGRSEGRFRRHDKAVRALRLFFDDHDLPRSKFRVTADRCMAMGSRGSQDWAAGYIVLEGARVFLREARARASAWTDWSQSVLYHGRSSPGAADARRIWLGLLRQELAHPPDKSLRLASQVRFEEDD